MPGTFNRQVKVYRKTKGTQDPTGFSVYRKNLLSSILTYPDSPDGFVSHLVFADVEDNVVFLRAGGITDGVLPATGVLPAGTVLIQDPGGKSYTLLEAVTFGENRPPAIITDKVLPRGPETPYAFLDAHFTPQLKSRRNLPQDSLSVPGSTRLSTKVETIPEPTSSQSNAYFNFLEDNIYGKRVSLVPLKGVWPSGGTVGPWTVGKFYARRPLNAGVFGDDPIYTSPPGTFTPRAYSLGITGIWHQPLWDMDILLTRRQDFIDNRLGTSEPLELQQERAIIGTSALDNVNKWILYNLNFYLSSCASLVVPSFNDDWLNPQAAVGRTGAHLGGSAGLVRSTPYRTEQENTFGTGSAPGPWDIKPLGSRDTIDDNTMAPDGLPFYNPDTFFTRDMHFAAWPQNLQHPGIVLPRDIWDKIFPEPMRPVHGVQGGPPVSNPLDYNRKARLYSFFDLHDVRGQSILYWTMRANQTIPESAKVGAQEDWVVKGGNPTNPLYQWIYNLELGNGSAIHGGHTLIGPGFKAWLDSHFPLADSRLWFDKTYSDPAGLVAMEDRQRRLTGDPNRLDTSRERNRGTNRQLLFVRGGRKLQPFIEAHNYQTPADIRTQNVDRIINPGARITVKPKGLRDKYGLFSMVVSTEFDNFEAQKLNLGIPSFTPERYAGAVRPDSEVGIIDADGNLPIGRGGRAAADGEITPLSDSRGTLYVHKLLFKNFVNTYHVYLTSDTVSSGTTRVDPKPPPIAPRLPNTPFALPTLYLKTVGDEDFDFSPFGRKGFNYLPGKVYWARLERVVRNEVDDFGEDDEPTPAFAGPIQVDAITGQTLKYKEVINLALRYVEGILPTDILYDDQANEWLIVTVQELLHNGITSLTCERVIDLAATQ